LALAGQARPFAGRHLAGHDIPGVLRGGGGVGAQRVSFRVWQLPWQNEALAFDITIDTMNK